LGRLSVVTFLLVRGFASISFSLGKFRSSRFGKAGGTLRSFLARQRQLWGSWHLVALRVGFRGIRPRICLPFSICGTDTPAVAIPAARGFSHPFSITRGPRLAATVNFLKSLAGWCPSPGTRDPRATQSYINRFAVIERKRQGWRHSARCFLRDRGRRVTWRSEAIRGRQRTGMASAYRNHIRYDFYKHQSLCS